MKYLVFNVEGVLYTFLAKFVIFYTLITNLLIKNYDLLCKILE